MEEIVIIDINLEKVSDDVLKHKASDDKVTLKEFRKEIKKHSKIKKHGKKRL